MNETIEEIAARKEEKATIKAISRHLRRNRAFEGGRQFGVDKITYLIIFPQIADVFNRCCNSIYGTKGKFYFPMGLYQ